uniref:C2H2-type domain-containing protein n=1 Tax=Acrobeloides nanus TaxID=290746 RepID=A0A914DIU2_9BILA
MTRQALLLLEIVEGSTLLSKSFPNHPMPFDFHCPSVQKELVSRVCAKCGQYFPSKIALKKHIKAEVKIDLIPNIQNNIHYLDCPVTTPSPLFEYEKGCPTEEDVEEELDIILELEQEDLTNALDNFPFFNMEDEDAYNALLELAND